MRYSTNKVCLLKFILPSDFSVLLRCTTVNVGETPTNYMILYIA